MRVRRLQRGKLDVLELKTHLKGVLPVDLGQVIRGLDRRAHFIRREESIASQCLQPIDHERR